MRSINNILSAALELYLANFNAVTLSLFQGVISLTMASLEGWTLGYTALHLVASITSVVALFQLWGVFLAYLGGRKSVALNVGFTGLYIALQSYHYVRHESLTYLLIHKNGHDALNAEGLGYVLGNISVLGWFALVAALLGIIILHRMFGILAGAKKSGSGAGYVIVLVVVNLSLPWVNLNASNEYVKFLSSWARFHSVVEDSSLNDDDEFLPYLKVVSPESEVNIRGRKDNPNVFIVMLESFSAYYMERQENGKTVTPFLDSLLDKE